MSRQKINEIFNLLGTIKTYPVRVANTYGVSVAVVVDYILKNCDQFVPKDLLKSNVLPLSKAERKYAQTEMVKARILIECESGWIFNLEALGFNEESSSVVDICFNSQEFKNAWQAYYLYAIGRDARTSIDFLRTQMNTCMKLGEEKAILALNQTIQKGWYKVAYEEPKQRGGRLTIKSEFGDGLDEISFD